MDEGPEQHENPNARPAPSDNARSLATQYHLQSLVFHLKVLERLRESELAQADFSTNRNERNLVTQYHRENAYYHQQALCQLTRGPSEENKADSDLKLRPESHCTNALRYQRYKLVGKFIFLVIFFAEGRYLLALWVLASLPLSLRQILFLLIGLGLWQLGAFEHNK